MSRFLCSLLLFAVACSLFAPAGASAATLTVTSDADSGAGSLREAISIADGTPGGDTILIPGSFPPQITLTTGELLITGEVSIKGPGADQVAVSGNHASRVFEIASGATVSISGLTISDGHVVGAPGAPGRTISGTDGANGTAGMPGNDASGGGILNAGDLTLSDVNVQGNQVSGGPGGTGGDGAYGGDSPKAKDGGNGGYGGGGGSARGGGIANTGNLTLSGVQFDGNQALGGLGGNGGLGGKGGTLLLVFNVTGLQGGAGGAAGGGGAGSGAAIFNAGSLTATRIGAQDNTALGGGAGAGGAGGKGAEGAGGAGGEGGNGGHGGQGSGGWLENDGQASVVGGILSSNAAVAGDGGNGGSGGEGTFHAQGAGEGGDGADGGAGGTGGFAAGGSFYLASPALIVDVDMIGTSSRGGSGGNAGAGGGGGEGACGDVKGVDICRGGGAAGSGGAGGTGGPADGGAVENLVPATRRVVIGNVLIRDAGATGGAGGSGGAGGIGGPAGSIVVNIPPQHAGRSGVGGPGGIGGDAVGGGIRNQGSIEVSGSTIDNATVIGGNAGEGGDGGHGGSSGSLHTACPGSGADGGSGGSGGRGLGGGIANVNELSGMNSTILENFARSGGGGEAGSGGTRGGVTCGAHDGSNGAVGQIGTSSGGGILQTVDPGNPTPFSTLTGLTLESNSTDVAAGGGNLAIASGSGSHMDVGNSIIGIAQGGSCAGPGIDSRGYNDDLGGACGFNLPTDLHVDPQLEPLSYNGGPTPTMAVLRTSPVVNQGNSFGSITGSDTDQRDKPRPYVYPGIPVALGGDGSDIGAFELQDEPASVSVSIPDTPIVANGISQTTVTVTVKDAGGNGVSGHELSFTSSDSGNQFGNLLDQGAGVYTVDVTSSTTAGPARITATDTTASPDVSGGACCLDQVAGPATRIKELIAPTTVVADGKSPVQVVAQVTDANGNHVSGDDVVFTSDDGRTFSATESMPNGIYFATTTATERLGSSVFTATDTSVNPPVDDPQTLKQTAGPAAKIEVSLDPATVPADGTTTTTASATVRDAADHPVTDESISFASTDPGQQIIPIVSQGNGLYQATITASQTAGPSTIRATAAGSGGSVFGEATLTQTPLPSNVIPVPPPPTPLTNPPPSNPRPSNPSPGSPQPSDQFNIVGKRLLARKGIAKLTFNLPGPGRLAVTQAGFGGASAAARHKGRKRLVRSVLVSAGPGRLTVTIRPTGSGKAILRREGKFRLRLQATYTPTGGSPASQPVRLRLKLKRARTRTPSR